jgi:hypothetical protein
MGRLRRSVAGVLVALGAASAPSDVRSAEFGFNIYPTGSLNLGAGATPPPGFYFTTVAGYYQGSISGNVNVGRAVAVGLDVKFFTAAANLLYVPKEEFLGGRAAFSVNIPGGHIGLNAQATVGALSASKEVAGWGLGDIMARAQLGWTQGAFSHTVYVSAWAPTGRYEPTFAPNIGLNRPAVDVTWGFTYLDPATKIELSGAAGLTFNAVNAATNYQTGVESHFEWAVGKHFSETVSLGVAGYHYVQLTGDSGSGATLGEFKGRNNGIGPALNFATKLGGHAAVLSLRHFWEYETVRHFGGTLSTAALTIRF